MTATQTLGHSQSKKWWDRNALHPLWQTSGEKELSILLTADTELVTHVANRSPVGLGTERMGSRGLSAGVQGQRGHSRAPSMASLGRTSHSAGPNVNVSNLDQNAVRKG